MVVEVYVLVWLAGMMAVYWPLAIPTCNTVNCLAHALLAQLMPSLPVKASSGTKAGGIAQTQAGPSRMHDGCAWGMRAVPGRTEREGSVRWSKTLS